MSDNLRGPDRGFDRQDGAARLRAVMPVIDRKVREGVRHEDIVEALEASGLNVSLNTFRVNLSRYRKRNRAEGAASASTHPKTHNSPPAAPGKAEAVAPAADRGCGLRLRRDDQHR